MIEDVITRRKIFARDVKRTVSESTGCRDEFGVVLETLQVVAELLEIGKLSSLHAKLLQVYKHTRIKAINSDMRRKHKTLRTELSRIAKIAQSSASDSELKELRFALDVAGRVLGIVPTVTTLLPDRQTRVTTREYFHFMVTEGAKEILSAKASAKAAKQEAMPQAA